MGLFHRCINCSIFPLGMLNNLLDVSALVSYALNMYTNQNVDFDTTLMTKLKDTGKKVVLIVEEDQDIADTMVEMFHRKGYYVYVESRVEKAKARLQVLDFTRTRIDLAVIHDPNIRTSSYFAKLLQAKHKQVKTVIFAEPEQIDTAPPTSAALLDAGHRVEIMAEAMSDCLDYSQEAMKRHMESLRKTERAWEVDAKMKESLKHGKKPTLAELNKYHANKELIIKRLAKMFLACFQAETRNYRRFLWKELKHHMQVLKFKVRYAQVRAMLTRYHADGKIEFIKSPVTREAA